MRALTTTNTHPTTTISTADSRSGSARDGPEQAGTLSAARGWWPTTQRAASGDARGRAVGSSSTRDLALVNFVQYRVMPPA